MRHALVTGAGQGIGRAIAARLAADGWSVLVSDVDGAAAEKAAADLGVRAATCDVTDDAAVRALATGEPELDLLVNNAGIFPRAEIASVDARLFRRVLDVNVVGPLLMTQAFLPQLTAAKGSVVNVASMAARVVTPGTGAYSPSKAALVSLTKLMAVELASTGIRFNAVAPGAVVTEGTAGVTADPLREERFNALVPLHRRGQPDDIADVVAFFAGDAARYVTGQVLYVDGGLSEATIAFLQAAQSSR
jgi:3-oxoacyl-[acyl-carrier protein] reductase